MTRWLNAWIFALCIGSATLLQAESGYLRENLKQAKAGDFIVTNQNKNYNLLHIYEKEGDLLTIEEITVPVKRMPSKNYSWRGWVENNAPNHTSWVMYQIHLPTGTMQRFYSFTNNRWYQVSEADNFLSRLLNLQLERVPDSLRKKIGPPTIDGANDFRRIWQPRMVVDGRPIEDVKFTAWRTKWPKDKSELSGRLIEIYVPEDHEKYPSYLPYWLQVSGLIGKAKVRIIDSGTQLKSPKPPLPKIT